MVDLAPIRNFHRPNAQRAQAVNAVSWKLETYSSPYFKSASAEEQLKSDSTDGSIPPGTLFPNGLGRLASRHRPAHRPSSSSQRV
ncbi:hypothetical protein VT03_32830 [Planctomyces sp. SH-PL14]|nr:hypothetical protein VT03_32830 [Planctomyces sp. SH-PL14]